MLDPETIQTLDASGNLDNFVKALFAALGQPPESADLVLREYRGEKIDWRGALERREKIKDLERRRKFLTPPRGRDTL